MYSDTHHRRERKLIESKQIMIRHQDKFVLESVMSGKRGKIKKKERKKESQNPPSFPPSQTWVFSIRFEMLGNMVPNLKCKQASIVALE